MTAVRRVVQISSAVLAIVVLFLIASTVRTLLLPALFRSEFFTTCIDENGAILAYDTTASRPPSSEFAACVKRDADLFLERDLAESKDLGKAFLTLLTAILVASITFSEKIVNVNSASWVPRTLMIGCWVCILGSIITCGIGLAGMTIAGGNAAYTPILNYRLLEFSAVKYFIFSGVLFCLGLVVLFVAGVYSLFFPSSPSSAAQPG